jgi:Fur family peroxide stress response transcriptional regulator
MVINRGCAMQVPADELARRMERFKAACREAGVKLTHQRLETFREVASTEEHPDVETVFRGVRERVPTVSLDTVYRTLWLLEDLGLLSRIGPKWGRTRFDANLGSHHHFVCDSCGLVRDFESAELDALEAPGEARRLGRASRLSVEVRGVCNACLERRVGRPA